MSAHSTILLSLHPQHAHKILIGEKRLEFRRVWAKNPVSTVVIYATAPIKRIVAVADVREVHEGSATKLWALAQDIGGGIPRRALYAYFKGKKTGYAAELTNVRRCDPELDPSFLIESFRPPQSFQYLHPTQLETILQAGCKQPRRQVIFVAGVHGVGKSTLCEVLARKEAVVHKSAGQIIREADVSALSDLTKAVSDIHHTQNLLIEGVKRIRLGSCSLLLDGHFALLNRVGQVEALPSEVFKELDIDGILLMHDVPENIYRRIVARDANPLSLAALTELQKVEFETAEKVAKQLSIPIVRVNASEEAAWVSAYASLISAQTSKNQNFPPAESEKPR